MAAQIIKNLQIQIQNIHIRYEDAYTNPKHPFSIGVSLAELLFQVQLSKIVLLYNHTNLLTL